MAPSPASSREWLESLAELSNELLGAASADGCLTGLNAAWMRELGWTRDDLTSKPFWSFIHPEDADATEATIGQLIATGGPEVSGFQSRISTSNGVFRWYEWSAVAQDGVVHILGKDVTGRVTAEAERDRTAAFTQAIADSVVDGLVVAGARGQLVFVNPAALRLLGYQSADELLGRPVHQTLHNTGLDGTSHPVADCPLLDVTTTGQPLHVEEDVFCRKDGTALAVAYSSAPIPLPDEVGTVVTFRDASAAQVERERLRAQGHHVVWFERIREALEDGRFVLYGQSIIELEGGEITKHELLLRMISPTGDLIAPEVFLPAAEKYGLINDIDRWVISEGIERAAGGPVAINLSAESVGRPEILLHIERELSRIGAPSENLTFEVTETALMGDLAGARRFADRLVALGCSFSLDDFGTGYGTLTYLRQLPISHIKIDVAFVRDLPRSETDQKLVEGIVHIARSLGQTTVAEGVEDQETIELLRGYGVDCAQGYHIGRPEPFAPTTPASIETSSIAPRAPHASTASSLTRNEIAQLRDVAADHRDVAAALRDEATEHEEGSQQAAADAALLRLLAASKESRSRAAADRTSARKDRQSAAAELKQARSGASVNDPASDERTRLRTSQAKMRDVIADARDRAAARDDVTTLAASKSGIPTSHAAAASRASSRGDRLDSATDRQESATDRKHSPDTEAVDEDGRKLPHS